MYFSVAFKLPNHNCLHIRNLTSSVGMDMVNMVRDEVGFKIPAAHVRIQHYCPDWNNKSYRININDEDIISHIPQFKTREHVIVIVPDGYMGRYWNMQIKNIGHNSDVHWFKRLIQSSKKTCNFEVTFDMDDYSILDDWIESGCPEFWEMSEEEIESTLSPSNEYYIISRNGYSSNIDFSYVGEMGIGDNVKDIVRTHKLFTEDRNIQAIIQKEGAVHIINLLAGRLDKNELNRVKDAINNELEHHNEE